MAASLHQHNLLLLVFFFFFTSHVISSVSQTPISPNSVFFLVTKDLSTLQYISQINLGTPHLPHKLVLDLNGPFSWIDCSSSHFSSSLRKIQPGSLQYSMAKTDDDKKGCLFPENTITTMAMSGELAEDIMAVDYVADGKISTRSTAKVHHFLFSCAPTVLLKGLASGATGILGLGKTRISLPSQLSNAFGFHRKFSICLSETEGVIFSGDGISLSGSTDKISKSLTYTPLVSKGTSEGYYYINAKSIKISGKKLSLGTSFEAKISTVVPYTTMESTVYDTFVKAYIKAATSMNMTMVAPVAPFGVCFSWREGLTPTVPIIDLVLQSEMVKWKIFGRNSMVKVSDEVICLGILDGGLSIPRNLIVIGGYQLEENLLEFNLGTSMLGFSSSLLVRQTSCSDFKLSNPTE